MSPIKKARCHSYTVPVGRERHKQAILCISNAQMGESQKQNVLEMNVMPNKNGVISNPFSNYQQQLKRKKQKFKFIRVLKQYAMAIS